MDPTPLDQTVRSIGRLQALFGVIPRIYGKGRNAEVHVLTSSIVIVTMM